MASILKSLTVDSSLSADSSGHNNKLSLAHSLTQKTLTTNTPHAPTLFPDFYGSYDYNTDNTNASAFQLFGLFPSDYEANGLSVASDSNASYFLGQKSDKSPIMSLSAPIFYILFMLGLYVVIIFTTFMSALYSHRKRVGYSYSEDGYSTQSDDSSDENQLLKPNERECGNELGVDVEDIEMLENFCQTGAKDCRGDSGNNRIAKNNGDECVKFENFYFENEEDSKQRKKLKLESRKYLSRNSNKKLGDIVNLNRKKLKKKQLDILSNVLIKKFIKHFPDVRFISESKSKPSTNGALVSDQHFEYHAKEPQQQALLDDKNAVWNNDENEL